MSVVTLSSDDARTKFRDLIDATMAGQETIIERYNKPVAVVVNYEQWLEWRRGKQTEQSDKE